MLEHLSPFFTGLVSGVAAQWVVAAVAHAMPPLRHNDSRWYVFAYRFVHFIGANLDRMRQGKLPAPQSRKAV